MSPYYSQNVPGNGRLGGGLFGAAPPPSPIHPPRAIGAPGGVYVQLPAGAAFYFHTRGLKTQRARGQLDSQLPPRETSLADAFKPEILISESLEHIKVVPP
jgi:hypothetical protein